MSSQTTATDPRSSTPSTLSTATSAGTGQQSSTNSIPQEQQPSSKDYNDEIRGDSKAKVRRPSFTQAKSISLHDHIGLHINLPASASHATSSGSLTDLDRCVVDMTAPTADVPLSGLAIKDVHRSLIIVGRVDGAAHLTGLQDAVVIVSARQVRIHDCHNVDLYIFCGSHPIIEDCQGMRFAPIPGSYVSLPSLSHPLTPNCALSSARLMRRLPTS